MDVEVALGALREQVAVLVERLEDEVAEREVTRRFDVLAAEVRSDAPLPDVARAAGTGLVITAAPWDDLGVACARLVDELLVSIEGETAWAEVDEEAWAAAAEPEEAEPEAGPEGIGGPIYPPNDD